MFIALDLSLSKSVSVKRKKKAISVSDIIGLCLSLTRFIMCKRRSIEVGRLVDEWLKSWTADPSSNLA